MRSSKARRSRAIVGGVTAILGLALGLATADEGQPGGDTSDDGAILPASPGNAEAGGSSIKISGTVTDLDGKAAPRVLVSVLPSFSTIQKLTDSEGRFALTIDPRQSRVMGATAPIVVARDQARNLAAAMELEEDATNASIRLEPALTLAGRISDSDGNALTNAQVQIWGRNERMAISLGSPIRAGADGRFEVRALPPGREYVVNVSAKGFGQELRNVPAVEIATNRMELELFRLVRADKRIAGVVLDEEDKPVARASIYANGNGQPHLNVQCDAQGRFSLDRVCAGPIQLFVNSRNGGHANVAAEGGDTNVVIRLATTRTVAQAGPQIMHLKGRPLPDLAPLGLTSADAPADRPLLAVLVDAEQRPSRRALRLLREQASAIKEKGVSVIVVHTGTMTGGDFEAWKQEAALPFLVVAMKGEAEKTRAAWGASALPWLLLTDKDHVVTDEGFTVEELEARLNNIGK